MRKKEKTAEDQFKRQNDFIKNQYDRVNLTMPKGKKENVMNAAEAAGESLNAFINGAIDRRMNGE